MITGIEICIDVPNLADGLAFYRDAFGFTVESTPFPHVVTLQAGNLFITVMEKSEGSMPSAHSQDVRRYHRHWTPVHLDFYVTDMQAMLAKVTALGAKCEKLFPNEGNGELAVCSDPFGNGFCLLQK